MQATRFSVRASAAKATTAPARNTKALNITKSILVDSNGEALEACSSERLWNAQH